jgi:hypothetical protein
MAFLSHSSFHATRFLSSNTVTHNYQHKIIYKMCSIKKSQKCIQVTSNSIELINHIPFPTHLNTSMCMV